MELRLSAQVLEGAEQIFADTALIEGLHALDWDFDFDERGRAAFVGRPDELTLDENYLLAESWSRVLHDDGPVTITCHSGVQCWEGVVDGFPIRILCVVDAAEANRCLAETLGLNEPTTREIPIFAAQYHSMAPSLVPRVGVSGIGSR